MANVPISNMTATWTDSGTTYTGIKMNVTDTASASGSLLMDLQTGGGTPVSRFSVRKDGRVSLSSILDINGFFGASSNYLFVASSGLVSFSGATSNGTSLRQDNTQNTLAQRNDTNAQTFNVYNTYTSSTNYERAKIAWSSNVLQIGTEKGSGGGTARALELQTDGTTRLTVESGGVVRIPAGTYNDAKLQIGSAAANAAALWYDATSGNTGLGISADGSSWVGSINKQGFLLGNQASSLWVKWGTTSSFPGLKRSSATLQARLADDSDYAVVDCAQIGTTKAYTVATLPAAGTAGRRAYVTDATTPTFLGTLTGGGSVVCPVFDNGTAWVAG